MAKEMRYGILIYLRDQAGKGIKSLRADVAGLNGALSKGFGGGAFGDFAKMFGGGAFGALAGKLATRPGGLGGILSDVTKGAASLALVPVRLLSSFASLIPGIGGIFSGVISTAANILQGLVGIVANIAGGILNAVTSLAEKIVSTIGTVLGKVVKVGAAVGLGLGAALAAAAVKGILGNLAEMRLKAVLKRRLGAAWQSAWEEITRLSPITGFEETALADALVILSRTDLSRPAQYLGVIADAAVGAGVSLTEVASLFAQVAARGEDLGRARMQLYQLGIPKAQVESVKTVADLAAVLQARFGGVAREVARLQPMAQVWRAIWEDVEGLTEGLTTVLVPALNKVADWLDRLRSTEAFSKINEGLKNAVGGAITWLETREWSWDNFKRAFDDLGKLLSDALSAGISLFASKDKAGAWHFGPMVDALKAAFDYVAAYVAGLFKMLWVQVGQDLANDIAMQLSKLGAGLQTHAAGQRGVLQWLGDKIDEFGAPGAPKMLGKILTGATGGDIVGPVGTAEGAAGQALSGIAERMFGASLTDDQKRAEITRIQAETNATQAEALQRLNAAAGEIKATVAPLGPEAAGVVHTALPRAGPEPANVGLGVMALPAAEQNRLNVLGQQIAGHEAAAKALRQQGLIEQAKRVETELASLRVAQTAVLETFIAELQRQSRELNKMQDRINRLGQARS